MVYFVQAEAGGLVKIGSAVDPAKRLALMQACCPIRLQLLATMKGGQIEERELHRRFERYREHGEWFKPSVALRVLILEKGIAPRAPNMRGTRWAEAGARRRVRPKRLSTKN